MKMTKPNRLRPLFRAGLVQGLLLITAGTSFHAADSEPTEPKDHAIFIGVDMSIENEAATGEIRNVAGSAAEIVQDGESRKVPLRALSGMKLTRQPKISTTTATLTNQKGIRTYTPAASPNRAAMQQQILMSSLRADKLEMAEKAIVNAELRGSSQPGIGGPPTIDRSADRAAGDAMYAAATVETSGNLYDMGVHAAQAQENAAKGDFDAYEITVEISAPEEIEDVYAAMITRVELPDEPGRTVPSVALRKIGTITPTPRRVRLYDAGFPPGFSVKSCEIHLYVQGREIATNTSELLLPVTRSDAFQYLLLKYLTEHRAQHVPAQVAAEMIPADFRNHVPAEDWDRSIIVRVMPDGLIEIVKMDPALSVDVVHYLEIMARSARFFPALRKGEPFASETTVLLSKFVR